MIISSNACRLHWGLDALYYIVYLSLLQSDEGRLLHKVAVMIKSECD